MKILPSFLMAFFSVPENEKEKTQGTEKAACNKCRRKRTICKPAEHRIEKGTDKIQEHSLDT